jgi:uncharacterized membrane protein
MTVLFAPQNDMILLKMSYSHFIAMSLPSVAFSHTILKDAQQKQEQWQNNSWYFLRMYKIGDTIPLILNIGTRQR